MEKQRLASVLRASKKAAAAAASAKSLNDLGEDVASAVRADSERRGISDEATMLAVVQKFYAEEAVRNAPSLEERIARLESVVFAPKASKSEKTETPKA